MTASGRNTSPPASYRPLTLSSGLRASAARDPDKTALILGDEHRTYRTVASNVNRIANLASGHLGLGLGDTAAIISPNSMEYLEIVAGVSDVGAAVATPNPRLSIPELADILNDCDAKTIFVHPEFEDRVDPSLLDRPVHVVSLGAAYDRLRMAASDGFTPSPIAEWETFSIPYTSGTTGRPKGVMLSHRSRTLGFLAYAAEYGCYTPDDHFLAISPMCHGAGFAFAFASLFLGGVTEIMTRFDPEAVLRAIQGGAVTGLFTVPTHHHAIFDLPPAILNVGSRHRLKAIIANAAPLSDDLKVRIIEHYGEGLLHETYGSTEAGVVTNLRPRDQRRKSRCVGLPFVGNRVRLLDDVGAEVGAGEVGELFSNSPYLFNGYRGRPDQTKEAFLDGWVSVGDLAVRDQEGFVHIVDRKKDMVITGGMNVYPREVEAVLDAHPDVGESAVIGAPDPRWGEKLVAFITPSAGPRSGAADLAAYCRDRLAPYKQPRDYRPIEALPRNANGKVLKTRLRELYFAQETSA